MSGLKLFGLHPDFKNHYQRWRRRIRKSVNVELILGEKACLKDFYNPLHPETYLIPRDKPRRVYEDEFGEMVAIATLDFGQIHQFGFNLPFNPMMPFSSFDFFINEDAPGGVYEELYKSPALYRLGRISQLGYLVPPREKSWKKNQKIYYLIPQFSHTRFLHSSIVAALADVVLARNGFTREERAPFILAAASHDIATPAGGDSVKRIDGENLDEEKNYTLVIKQEGLDKKWKHLGFKTEEAQDWIDGKGTRGKLLDKLDRISYTAVDNYAVGSIRAGKIRRFGYANPLVMDVWQDIRVERDKVYFTDPERLYKFLWFRALEHSEFLFNPECRALDHTLSRAARILYLNRQVTKEELLAWGSEDLRARLEKITGVNYSLATPDDWHFRKFIFQKKADEFCRRMGNKIDHTEHIKPFKTGLDWLVSSQGATKPLREAISKEKVVELERLADSVAGWYAYYIKEEAG